MKPTKEQVIAWTRETHGEPIWGFGIEWTWDEIFRFSALAYEAGRKYENEACVEIAAYILKMPQNDVSAVISARMEP
jgi:hypothetical protein